MPGDDSDLIFRDGRPPSEGGYPGHVPGTRIDKPKEITCEYDVAVSTRDDIELYVDVFRPEGATDAPVLVVWGPYGKHQPESKDWENRPGAGVAAAGLSEYTIFEGPDPAYWCSNGYAIVHADPRGAWGSEGDLTFMSEQEATDCCDVIEWAGTRDWSNGKVGMIGVSYLAWTQWRVAELDPPHLEAINPTEGVSDFYREAAFHGGIRSEFFPTILDGSWSFSKNRVEDIEAMMEAHQLFDEYWAGKNADLSEITVPAYVVASWPDHGLHTRGTLEAFKQLSSEQKWLRVHGRKKWQDFYQEEERQRQFFDRFLKGEDSEVEYWPRVKLEVRERYFVGEFRDEDEWPIARTDYTELYLDASDGSADTTLVEEEASVRYDVDDAPAPNENVQFEYEFDEETELTGHMKLKLWVQADGSDDLDLFVEVAKIDRTGDRVPFPFQTIMDDGPVALGWLRASHRELDEERSTRYQPVHPHTSESPVEGDETVPVEIEIWPSSTLFNPGERLRLTVQGSDIYGRDWPVPLFAHQDLRNAGEHVIHTGGEYDSHLLLPVIPERE